LATWRPLPAPRRARPAISDDGPGVVRAQSARVKRRKARGGTRRLDNAPGGEPPSRRRLQ
jgi:hypothetical protein